MDNDERLFDEIATLEEENKILREVRDELMEENEKLRKEKRELENKLGEEMN